MTKVPESKPLCGSQQSAGDQLALELLETAKLAGPMVLTQLGQIAMMTTDLALVGRIGVEAIAAAGLASRVYVVSFAFGASLLAAIAPLVTQAYGVNNLALLRRLLRMGLWTALLLSLPIMAFALRGEQILVALGQDSNIARLAQQYLFGVAWGVAPVLCFEVMRLFMGAASRPAPVLWITLGAIPANALLGYFLIYGKMGLPGLGLFGAGLASTLVNCGMCLAALGFATKCGPFREYRLLADLWRFDWELMWQLIVIGTPISTAFLIGYSQFSAAALLAGLISTDALAAHQIVVHVANVLLMISFGISAASTVRVGQAVSRNDGLGIKRAGVAAFLLGAVIAAMLTIGVIVARFQIAELFLSNASVDPNSTIVLAAELLLAGAIFFISDALRCIATGALRGLKDTLVPLFFATIAYWPIGLVLSYVLGFEMELGAFGLWLGLSIGTTVYAVLLGLRFQILANRLTLR